MLALCFNNSRSVLVYSLFDAVYRRILSQIFDVIQSEVALQKQVQ